MVIGELMGSWSVRQEARLQVRCKKAQQKGWVYLSRSLFWSDGVDKNKAHWIIILLKLVKQWHAYSQHYKFE
jgi:hypothetical protein